MPTTPSSLIHIAAVALLSDRQILVVRKRNTDHFILPGGKFEPDETALEVVSRELHEELGINLAPETLNFFGTFTAPAVN